MTTDARVKQIVRGSLERAGLANRGVVGVACAELETWFLLSRHAMEAACVSRAVIATDTQADCDAERVNPAEIGKIRLEEAVPRYNAAMAKRMAAAIVGTPYAAEQLLGRSASFGAFAEETVEFLGGTIPDP